MTTHTFTVTITSSDEHPIVTMLKLKKAIEDANIGPATVAIKRTEG